MEVEDNRTLLTDFVIVGFTTEPFLRTILFVVFLALYILTLTGNLGLMTLIYLDSRLHTPMYFFVGSLSFLDVWYSSVYIPRILYDSLSKNNHISLAGCATQFFFSATAGGSECFLLAFMAYDRFVAICHPLLYATAMPKKLCVQLVLGAYAVGFANAIIHTGNTFRLHFCGSNIINHYFCDVPPLMKMACDDKGVYEIILTTVIGFTLLAATAVIVKSYISIVAAIIRIRSAAGRRKAFSTCSAHLLSVSLYYGSMLITYSAPNSHHTVDWDKINALFYTVINPLVNPLIYSLRNKDVKAAFKKVWGKFTAHK
ncbi:olfactory receptor 9G4-like [Crotalus tigris]|uniref:olfactory receptor 9G4-like n=1 Tax=Crotalus tigris TaxID=88082 RepID=UPI00192F93FD|nr:olfactory receptor 9G4-like [Crotalus tigris]XP_039200160.1 olfactory receptor 9G4-like [Crotalus tigris]XP_039200161.1 olfactory receptor 9G4-like [Crotalus tigris]XP_039200162.1 olfactory receptor 9G4-like [Crotalus tigris]